MDANKIIIDVIYRAINKSNSDLKKSPETKLYGNKSLLDSLSFLLFIVACEEELEKEFEFKIELTGEETISNVKMHFKTIQILSRYIFTIIEKKGKLNVFDL